QLVDLGNGSGLAPEVDVEQVAPAGVARLDPQVRERRVVDALAPAHLRTLPGLGVHGPLPAARLAATGARGAGEAPRVAAAGALQAPAAVDQAVPGVVAEAELRQPAAVRAAAVTARRRVGRARLGRVDGLQRPAQRHACQVALEGIELLAAQPG